MASNITANSSQWNQFYIIGLMPFLMGFGHLVPAIGAIHTATGSYQYPWALFGMIITSAALVDCGLTENIIVDLRLTINPIVYDTYKILRA
jgi:hypothetical protein